MGTRVTELVERFGGQLQGDPDTEVTAIAPLERAGAGRHQLPQQQQDAAAGGAQPGRGPDPVAAGRAGGEADSYDGARIVTGNPYAYFARTAQFLLPRAVPEPGIHPSAVVHASARVDPAAHIGPQVTVEAGAVIKAGAVIDAGCYVGREAVVGEGTHFFANVTSTRAA
jgi:UDP-3-O-[3-hydroxymyristoyl] glucosamine N-acyltransferase